jgi:hypothetical protein
MAGEELLDDSVPMEDAQGLAKAVKGRGLKSTTAEQMEGDYETVDGEQNEGEAVKCAILELVWACY